MTAESIKLNLRIGGVADLDTLRDAVPSIDIVSRVGRDEKRFRDEITEYRVMIESDEILSLLKVEGILLALCRGR